MPRRQLPKHAFLSEMTLRARGASKYSAQARTHVVWAGDGWGVFFTALTRDCSWVGVLHAYTLLQVMGFSCQESASSPGRLLL